ncbi:uracil-DNA glycosylase family protein [Aureimonas ureilytica]|uniref:uracil-DNA glycosylase family protein n=1 Tax=Aureimonas ureilytica TaxID=401562 RepID=UPI00035D0ADC
MTNSLLAAAPPEISSAASRPAGPSDARERSLDELCARIRACRMCRDAPLGTPLEREPNPVFVLSPTARICIAGQAPGNLADRSGRPFTDPSGVRLRAWMGVGEDVFYDSRRVAIVPMGFCFPGTDPKGGDRPPRPECRRLWHAEVFAAMPQLSLILAVGRAAQSWHLGPQGLAGRSVAEALELWMERRSESREGPTILPLPHPSWRNSGWISRNPWFEETILPELRQRIAALV